MVDPPNASSGVVGLVEFAFQCSDTLYHTVRTLQNQDKRARALKGKLGELCAVLKSLLETVNNNPALGFQALERPLRRCGNACQEYGQLIACCTEDTTDSQDSLQDWVAQRYLQGDIMEFKDMLAGYKATIDIALANEKIRVTGLNPEELEDYQDMVRDRTADLQENLERFERKVQQVSARSTEDSGAGEVEWQAMLEERESTRQGLKMCAQLLKWLENLERASKEQHKLSGPSETKESEKQRISVVTNKNGELVFERRNIFEDITMADEAYDFSVSTVGDLVTARKFDLKGRARHVGGQMTDESYQKTIEAFTQLDMMAKPANHTKPDPSSVPASETDAEDKCAAGTGFSHRHGPGFTIAQFNNSQ